MLSWKEEEDESDDDEEKWTQGRVSQVIGSITDCYRSHENKNKSYVFGFIKSHKLH